MPLQVDLGVGDARVIVPEDVCVATDAQVGVGEVRTFGRHNEGIDVDFDDLPDAAPDTTRLLVKAEVGVGSLRIGQSGPTSTSDHGHFDFGPPTSGELGATGPVRRSPDVDLAGRRRRLVALGVLLLLDASGTFDLRFSVLGPAACAATGAILLASGLTRPR